jgi:hypothetical protein
MYPKPCVHGDLLLTMPEDSFSKDSNFEMKLYDVNRADFYSHQHCYTHNWMCPLFGPPTDTDLEVAGLPCTDQSKGGDRKFEEGKTAVVFMAHSKRHTEKRTPLIIIENVQEKCRIIYCVKNISDIGCLSVLFALLGFWYTDGV